MGVERDSFGFRARARSSSCIRNQEGGGEGEGEGGSRGGAQESDHISTLTRCSSIVNEHQKHGRFLSSKVPFVLQDLVN